MCWATRTPMMFSRKTRILKFKKTHTHTGTLALRKTLSFVAIYIQYKLFASLKKIVLDCHTPSWLQHQVKAGEATLKYVACITQAQKADLPAGNKVHLYWRFRLHISGCDRQPLCHYSARRLKDISCGASSHGDALRSHPASTNVVGQCTFFTQSNQDFSPFLFHFVFFMYKSLWLNGCLLTYF